MTPKEKAKELIDKMYNIDFFDDYNEIIKKSALIVVDEVLKAIPGEYLDVWKGETNMIINDDVAYWERVKQEIEKL